MLETETFYPQPLPQTPDLPSPFQPQIDDFVSYFKRTSLHPLPLGTTEAIPTFLPRHVLFQEKKCESLRKYLCDETYTGASSLLSEHMAKNLLSIFATHFSQHNPIPVVFFSAPAEVDKSQFDPNMLTLQQKGADVVATRRQWIDSNRRYYDPLFMVDATLAPEHSEKIAHKKTRFAVNHNAPVFVLPFYLFSKETEAKDFKEYLKTDVKEEILSGLNPFFRTLSDHELYTWLAKTQEVMNNEIERVSKQIVRTIHLTPSPRDHKVEELHRVILEKLALAQDFFSGDTQELVLTAKDLQEDPSQRSSSLLNDFVKAA